MLDKATVLTTIYTIVDDAMKGSAVIQAVLDRPGPSPKVSGSEVVTIALYQELIVGSDKPLGCHSRFRRSTKLLILSYFS